jgi:hypothetical protein
MAGHQAVCGELGLEMLGLGGIAQRQVERGRLGQTGGDGLRPLAPARGDCIGKRRRLGQFRFALGQSREDAVRQSAWSARQQRKPGRDHGVERRTQSQPLRQHQPQDLPRFRIVGQILARGAVDQRVEIDRPAQGFARNGAGERLVLELADVGCRRAESDIERLAPPENGIEQAKRGAARVDTGGLSHGAAPKASRE